MIEQTFGVAAYAACGTRPAEAPDLHWTSFEPPAEPTAGMPAVLRRRVSPVGQAALRSAWLLPSLDTARFIFCSRNGEMDRTLAMLTQMAGAEPPSPADFSLSVHNALAGLLSVATRNRNGHTALAAGLDTFGFGLMEAAACLHESPSQPVILVNFDAPLPPDYPDAAAPVITMAQALALLLVAPSQAPHRVIMLAEPDTSAEPQDAATVFLDFLQTTAPQARAAGETMCWTWRHA